MHMNEGETASCPLFLSPFLSPAEPPYLPHLAHGANGNQPFSGEQKAERKKEKNREMHALSLSLMEPLEVFRRRKLDADTGVKGTEGQRDGGRGEEEMAGGIRKQGAGTG